MFFHGGLPFISLGERELRRDSEASDYPLLPVRDVVVFPRLLTPVFVGRDQSLRAIEAALASDSRLVIVTQRDPEIENPTPEDLYEMGTEVVVGRILRMPDGTTSVLTQGQRRVRITDYVQTVPYLRVTVQPIVEVSERTLPMEAMMRAVLTLFEKCVQLDRNLPEEAYVAAMNIDEPGWLADMVASVVDLSTEERLQLLSTLDPYARLQSLSVLLNRKLELLELENQIQSQVQQEVDKSQREYYLREQMRIIQSELGEIDSHLGEINSLREKLAEVEMPAEVRARAEHELNRLAAMPAASPEASIVRTYFDWLIELPWTEETEDNQDIQHVARVLDANHYGLPEAKERILEHIAVRQRAGAKMRTPILCFVGPPGTGKTSLGRSIAEALGRRFVRVSLGGIRDEAEIRGHRRTYIGAMPGRIIQTMRRAGTVNPVFMLDEIDKVGADFRGDPSAALLEALDPEQNHAFSDHYLEVPYDLSRVMFITTANLLDPIPPALRDRMEIIRFPGYVEEEKMGIARQFLIPRQLEEHGLSPAELRFSTQALRTIIREYTYEAGVRNLEREIGRICRKVARRMAEGKKVQRLVTPTVVHKYLGPPQYVDDLGHDSDEVGVAMGIAWTEAGGDIMPVEVSLMPGKGSLILTGQLGEVMQESAQAALSYARSHAEQLGIQEVDFDQLDIHIHVPEGAVPKDGPSAGVTLATALISALTGRPVRHKVAMTGEITLRGRVLAVGGLKEKVLAAHRAKAEMVVIPRRNQKDLVEIPKHVQRELQFVYAERIADVLNVALLPAAETPATRIASKKKTKTGKRAAAAARSA
ncbi:MAG: endopeptidase La [Ardenticatenia bacterium]|jgi:ATP-dependent Lon protease|nr:MAG: endopeptidase La [Ardenticatenia bacterium]